MPTEALSTSPLPAAGLLGSGTQPRSPRQRAIEVINIRDFGAVGDGVTDDGPALIAAFNFLLTLVPKGRELYFPRGKYWIDPSHLPINLDLYSYGSGHVGLSGDGKDASWIISNFGSNGNGYYTSGKGLTATSSPMFFVRGANSSLIQNLTFWNKSSAFDAVVLFCNGSESNAVIDNCRFLSPRGVVWEEGQFGSSFMACEFRSGYPTLNVNRADSTTKGPIANTCGLYFSEGNITACSFAGFDVGLSLSASTMYDTTAGAGIPASSQSERVTGCSFSQCNSGIKCAITFAPAGVNGLVQDVIIQSNWFDHCSAGLHVNNFSIGPMFVSNVFSGARGGPANPAPMTVTWDGSTVTCTTPTAHNISGNKKLVVSGIRTSAVDNFVFATINDVTHFSFPSTVDPGAASGQWNYPAWTGIYLESCQDALFAAHVFTQAYSNVGFDWSGYQSRTNQVWAMQSRYGIARPTSHLGDPNSVGLATGVEFLQCYSTGQSPPDVGLPGSGLGLWAQDIAGLDGNYTIIDCPTLANFGDVLAVYAKTATAVADGVTSIVFQSIPAELVVGMKATSMGDDTGLFPTNRVTVIDRGTNTITFDTGTQVPSRTNYAGMQVYFSLGGWGEDHHYKIGTINGKQVRVG